MPQNEVAEADDGKYLAGVPPEHFVAQGVIEGGHEMPHLVIRYDSTAARSVSERAEL